MNILKPFCTDTRHADSDPRFHLLFSWNEDGVQVTKLSQKMSFDPWGGKMKILKPYSISIRLYSIISFVNFLKCRQNFIDKHFVQMDGHTFVTITYPNFLFKCAGKILFLFQRWITGQVLSIKVMCHRQLFPFCGNIISVYFHTVKITSSCDVEGAKINWGWIFPCTQYVTLQHQQLKPEIDWLIDWLVLYETITKRTKIEVGYVHV